MQVNFTPGIEKKLAQSAARQGCHPDELVQEVVAQHLDEERRFIEAVDRGEAALQRGEFLTHEQAGQRLGQWLYLDSTR